MMKPSSPPQFTPPTRLATLLEFRAPLDSLSLALKLPKLRNAPIGDGRPVLLLPGFKADVYSMWPLKRYLRRLGYDTYDWSLGRNDGNVDRMVERMTPQVAQVAESTDEAVTLIGWSLGGVVARELARLYPDTVREVITMGTPIVGGPKYTAAGDTYARDYQLDLDVFEQEVHARNSIGIKQPVTSIYSRQDGIVSWRASVDTYNPQARNIEVYGSHLGLGVNATVWRHIADILAAS
ncbi:MAG: alpha/beta fold hydrolase [Pseudomonadota bacterium]